MTRPPQAYWCRQGSHAFGDWGNYQPVRGAFRPAVQPKDVTPEYKPVEAYRWRECECGVTERQSYATGEIARFNRHEERES